MGANGAAGGDRTHDPWLRRPILYPLSYSRIERAAIVGALSACVVQVLAGSLGFVLHASHVSELDKGKCIILD